MCGIGDIVTAEALAATALLKEYLPWINIRFVNVVDLQVASCDRSFIRSRTDHPDSREQIPTRFQG
jgi:phosphoketolase